MNLPTSGQGAKGVPAKPRFSRKAILAVIGLVIVALIAWWQISLSSAGTPVKTAEVTRDDIELYVSAPAKVTLPSRADLSFKTGGKIQAVHVKKGDEVAAGQILAELDMGSIYPQINQAEAGLKVAQAGLDKLLSGRSRREIAVAEASVDQASTAVENARQSLKTVKKIIAQSKQKAALGIKNAEAGYDTASQQLTKVKTGARGQERVLADSQVEQALQALTDAEVNYDRVKSVTDRSLDEANQSATSTYDSYAHAKDIYEATPTTDTAYNLNKSSYLQAKATYEGALAAKNRVAAANDQTLQTAEAQINAARKAYETTLAQYGLTTAPARTEDLAIAKNQLAQAQIALEIAKLGSDDASLDAQLDAAQAQLNTAIQGSRLAIAQLDLQNEGARVSDIRAAQGQIEQAQAALALAETGAEDAALKAPFSGKVAAINGKAGEIAGVSAALGAAAGAGSSALITLISFDRIELSADVDETEVGKLKVGQNSRVMLDSYEDKVFDGKLMDISLISSKNATGGTIFGVTIIVNPGKDEFREGMSGDVDIITSSKKNVLTVPFDAVKIDGKKATVYVVKNGIARVREVTLGLASDTAYEVVSGLDEGDVVVTGKAQLTDGQQVKVEKDGRIGQ